MTRGVVKVTILSFCQAVMASQRGFAASKAILEATYFVVSCILIPRALYTSN
jgi:hypothetical protein